MSETRERLTNEMKAAMKSGNKDRLGVIRMLISEIKNAEIDDPKTPQRVRTEDEVIAIIAAYHKNLVKTIAEFPPERHPPMLAEIAIVEDFLPKQLSKDEIRLEIKTALESDPERNFGLLMKKFQVKFAGKADGKSVSEILKDILNSLK